MESLPTHEICGSCDHITAQRVPNCWCMCHESYAAEYEVPIDPQDANVCEACE